MNSLSLYNITSAFPMIMEQEEMAPELKEELERELTILLQEKSQNIIGYVRNMELTVDAMKTEEKRISEQRKGIENKIEKFKNYDLILVDTAGRSHKSEEQKEDLKQIIDSVKEYETEVFLVVSATVKYADLLSIANTYGELFDYNLIFTKLDETNGLGSILNLKLDTGKPLSYVTWGQNVPDDIGVLDPQIIAKKLLGGGK